MPQDVPQTPSLREARIRQIKKTTESSRVGQRGRAESWAGQSAAIYCRISHVNDEDQTGVERQERICREIAERLRLVVPPELVFVDNNRSAWKRNRKRKGWEALLEAARQGVVRHIIAYHPDRLMRQPKDLEEILTISDDADITLHGQANRRELSDPDDRFFLRIEVAHACRSSDDASRRLRDAQVDRAHDGKPHSGKRRYGYTPDGMTPVPAEAQIVREIFARYLDGDSPRVIAADLNERTVPTRTARPWDAARILGILDSRHVAGIRVFRGEEVGRGEWEPLVDMGTFSEAAERRTFRAAATRERSQPTAYYLLRGLVTCGRCSIRMNGTGGKFPAYMCGRHNNLGDDKCVRRISAPQLEKFVVDATIRILENLELSENFTSTALTPADREAIQAATTELTELKDMWKSQELRTREYREMKAIVEARIADLEARTVVRPTSSILRGITGPGARSAWQRLTDEGQRERQNAILRFLFAAAVIGPSSSPGRFDYSRIHLEMNPL